MPLNLHSPLYPKVEMVDLGEASTRKPSGAHRPVWQGHLWTSLPRTDIQQDKEPSIEVAVAPSLGPDFVHLQYCVAHE